MTRPALFSVVAFLLLFAVAAWQSPVVLQQSPGLPAAPDAQAGRWVERTLAAMSLEEKLGQLLMVHYYGGFTSAESEEYKELLRRVEQQHIGGIVVSTRGSATGTRLSQAYPTAALANQLQRRAKYPLLVAADFERGTAMRIAEGTGFPYAMAVAATGAPQSAYEMARITAIEARAVGVHWNFAPVADVNVNPENPIINTRAFGEDPQRVAEFASAFVRGSEEHGVLATAKHFPGHGDTSVDSHVSLPIITGDRARLDRVELLPFRAAIEAGVSTIMTAHLAVPALETDAALPATMSPRIHALLRGELGFTGLVVTDALSMGGVTAQYAPGDVAVRAIAAGADVLLVPPVPDAALLALREAVQSGRLSQQRIDISVRRILTTKARLGLHEKREVDLDKLNEVFGRPDFAATAEAIADRGVTLLRDTPQLLPLDATKPSRVLLVAIAGDPDALPGAELERELRWRVENVQAVRCDTRWVKAEWVELPPASSYDVAVLALFVRVADRKGTVGLPRDQAALARQVLAAGKPVVTIGFGSPYLVERFPEALTWLGTFSTFDVNQRAAARALFGQTAIAGQLPVTVPGVAKLGDGLRLAANPMVLRGMSPEARGKFQRAYDLAGALVGDGQMSGATLVVGHRSQAQMGVMQKNDPASGAAFSPVLTAMAVAALVEQGLVQLDAPLTRYLPELNGSPAAVSGEGTVRQLLRELAAPAGRGAMRRAAETNLREIIRRVTGQQAEDFIQERLLRRLGVPEGERFAERELAAFAQMMLNGGVYGHQRILKRGTIEVFTARQRVGDTVRALGWDVGPWGGGPLSRRAYGYDAENGASLWIDPEKELFIIFLPAEVKPGAEEKVRALRDPLHRAVVEGLGLAAPPAAR